MHELLLAKQICDTVNAHVGKGQRVTNVVVECGPVSGVVPEMLESCFPIAAEESGLAGVQLDLRCLSAKARCAACGEAFYVETMWARCPSCDHGPVTIEGGRELSVKEIEVDDV